MTQSFKDLLLNERNPNHLFIAGYTNASGVQVMAMHKTLDGGTTWDTFSISDSAAGDSVLTAALAVAIDPANDRTIYLGGTINSAGALYKSLDGGTSWTKLGAGIFADPILDLAVDPSTPAAVYAGTDGGLFRSENGGATWTKLADTPAACIYVDPVTTSSVTIAGKEGVSASANSGQDWTDLNATLPARNVLSLGVNPTTKTLFVGTNGGGVFRYRQSSRFVLSLSATTGGTTSPAPGNHDYSMNSQVSVTALPDSHFAFTGWTGSATGTVNPLTVLMDSDKSLTAGFLRTIYPPLNAAGVKKLNRGAISAEYINVLSWQPNSDNVDIRAYRIYSAEEGTRRLLAEVEASTAEFRQRRVEKDKTYTYGLVAVDKAGREGQEATIVVR